jgi:GNAT superfamily N-acetyltransferase
MSEESPIQSALQVRWLVEHEWPHAYPLMHALRTQLSESEFLRRMSVQTPLGYRLAAALDSEGTGTGGMGQILGLLGVRTVASLSRGVYLHVDDLVVDEAAKRGGVGRLLMKFADEHARAEGMQAIFLDSRPSAIPFYGKLGYALHPSPSMWRSLI